MTLITDSELGALQDLVLSGLKTTVYVYSRSTDQTEDGQETTYPSTPSFSVLGWLYEITPNATALGVIDGGQTLSEVFRLMVPVGTNIVSNDKLVIGAGTYYVEHTSADDTYPTSLILALRNFV